MFKNIKVKEIIYNSLLLALLIVTSKITIPIFIIPFTLQMLMIIVICLTTKLRDSLVIVLLYIALGLLGVPVFAQPTAGIAYLMIPSFGFVLGFILMVLFVPLLKKISLKLFSRESYIMISLFLLLIDYLVGFTYSLILIKWLKIIEMDITVLNILFSFIVIFIPFDIIKCILASIIAKRINNSTR